MPRLRFLLLLAATSIGLVGTLVILKPARTAIGVSFLALSAGLGFIASAPEKPPAFAQSLPFPPSAWRRILSFGLLLSAAIANLWGIKLLEIAQTPLPWLFYSLSLFYFGLAFYILEEPQAVSHSVPKAGSLTLVLILLLAFSLRTYQIGKMPPGIYYDEACNALDAIWAMGSGTYPAFFEACNGRGPLLIYSLSLALRLLGKEPLALRLVPVFYGLAGIIALYLLLKLVDEKLALAGAFLLGIMRWHFHFSRVVFDAITVPFFAPLSLYFLWRGFLRGRRTDFLLAGFVAGWGFMGYAAFRLFPILALASFAPALFRGQIKHTITALLIFLTAFLLASAPILSYAAHHPDAFLHRSRQVYLLRFHPQPAWLEALKRNAQTTLLMFHQRGDFNPRHNLPDAPMLDPVTGALMAVGIGICLRRALDWRYSLMLLWLILFLQPGIWSIEAPQALRNIGVVTAVAFMASLPLKEMASTSHRFLSRGLPGLLMLSALALNAHTYFFRQARDIRAFYAFYGLETTAGKIISSLGPSYRFYSIYATDPTVLFLLPPEIDLRFLDHFEHIPLREETDRDILYLVDPRYDPPLETFLHWYPEAKVQEIPDPLGKTMLRLIKVRKEEINGSMRLRSLLQNAGEEGSLFIPETGFYTIKLNGLPSARLSISGAEGALSLKGGEEVNHWFIKGWHDLRLEGIGQIEIHGGKLAGLAPRELLNLHPAFQSGLTGYYYRGTEWSGEPVFARIDPYIAFRWHIQPLPAPFSVEWKGFLKIGKPGYYGFALLSNSPSSLEIDGQQILETSSDLRREVQVYLSQGEHKVRVRFKEPGGYTAIYLYWKPPGKSFEVLPPQALEPLWGERWNEW